MSCQTGTISGRRLRWRLRRPLSRQRGRTGRRIANMFGYAPGGWDGCGQWSGHPWSVLPPSHPEVDSRGSACRGGLRGAEMGFAWMPEDGRQASGDVDLDDDTASWRYGRGNDRSRAGSPGPLSAAVRGSVPGQESVPRSVSVRHRTGRHAQGKDHRPVLASLAAAGLRSLRRAHGSRSGVSEALTGGTDSRHQPERRMAGRGAHAASWPAAPPR